MAKVKVELNLPGINDLMRSQPIQDAVENAGKAVAQQCRRDFETKSGTIRWIAFCNVYPNSKSAAKQNYDDNSLVKGLSAVGLKMSK